MFIIVIISLMLTGVLIGYFARRRNTRFVQRIITALIWILLFLLGTEVGHNKDIMNGLHTIGLEALIITLAGVAGSTFASWWLWMYISKKRNKEEAKS